MTARVMNFNAGPAALPLPALERAQRELLDFAGTGMSVMEQSHRGKEYEAVHDEALAFLRELLRVPDAHDILFLQGGATQQFAQVPMNFLHKGTVRRLRRHRRLEREGDRRSAVRGNDVRRGGPPGREHRGGEKPVAYVRTPSVQELDLDPDAAYVHFTTNETIYGIQFANEPGEAFPDFGGLPVVCDMSSDFMWRPIDVSRFAFIYAGAQKNIGPSGVVVAIAKKDFVARGRKDIPNIFQYRAFAEANSLLNTPPTFGIYLVRNVLEWLKGERRARGAREAQPREGASPLRRHRRERRLLPLPRRAKQPFGDERGLPPAHARSSRTSSFGKPRRRGWSASADTARSAGSARPSTTRSRWSGCTRSWTSCGRSRAPTAEAPGGPSLVRAE